MIIPGLRHIVGRLTQSLLVVAASAVLTMTSCDTPSAPGDSNPGDEEMMSISFRVATSPALIPRPKAGESATTGQYENGTVLESTIDFAGGSYRIYFFDDDENNKFITAWNTIYEMHVVKGINYWEYTFEGKVPEKLLEYCNKTEEGGTFSVMVLANWPDYPERHTLAENMTGLTIKDVITNAEWSIFNAFDSYELSVEKKRLIPFYALHTYTGIHFEQEKTKNLGQINLLRAVAKVEVTIDSESLFNYVKISEKEDPVTICGINPQGYCGTDSGIGDGENWSTDYVTKLHLPFKDNNNHPKNHPDALKNHKSMLRLKDADGKETNTWIAYVPEFKNKYENEDSEKDKEQFSHIEIKLDYYTDELKTQEKFDGTRTFNLYFATYDNLGHTNNSDMSKRFNIKRNDLYRFTVTGGLVGIIPKIFVGEWNFCPQDEIIM